MTAWRWAVSRLSLADRIKNPGVAFVPYLCMKADFRRAYDNPLGGELVKKYRSILMSSFDKLVMNWFRQSLC